MSSLIRTLVGIVGNVASVGLFLSASTTFRDIVRNRSVQEYSFMPYLMALLNCVVWVLYGSVHPGGVVVLVVVLNGMGACIQIVYVAIYLRYSAGTARRNAAGLFGAGLALASITAGMVLGIAHTPEVRSMVFGVIGIISGTAMYAAPLSIIAKVIETRSVQYLSFPMAMASFVNAMLWSVYAVAFIPTDKFIAIPNLIGVLLALMQIGMFAYYKWYNNGGAGYDQLVN